MSPRTPAALATVALLAVTVSGCSDSTSTPRASDVVASAKKNADAARSAAMTVAGSVQGQAVTLTADGALDGSNQHQTQSAAKLKSESYIIGTTAYFKANTDFLTANGMSATEAVKTADTWWSRSLGSSSQGAAVDVRGLVDQFFAGADGTKLKSSAAKVSTSRTNGQDTYTVTASGTGPALVVTRGATPHIVEIRDYPSELTQNTKATYRFSRWNDVTPFTAPAGSKPLSSASGSSSSTASPSASPGTSSPAK